MNCLRDTEGCVQSAVVCESEGQRRGLSWTCRWRIGSPGRVRRRPRDRTRRVAGQQRAEEPVEGEVVAGEPQRGGVSGEGAGSRWPSRPVSSVSWPRATALGAWGEGPVVLRQAGSAAERVG